MPYSAEPLLSGLIIYRKTMIFYSQFISGKYDCQGKNKNELAKRVFLFN